MQKLLSLLQLASSSLPVGAYSYAEGLEFLVENKHIDNKNKLNDWLTQELTHGSIRLETAIMLRAYQSFSQENFEGIIYWNNWLSAARETQELRQQSWQMGQSLIKLLIDLHPELKKITTAIALPCNYAIAFGIGVAYRKIDGESATVAYLYSWLNNLINSAVKLIPLGQTAGQQLLFNLSKIIPEAASEISDLKDDELSTWSLGLNLASMNHETQYTRLFRS